MVNFLLVPPRTIYPISTVHNEYIATLELEVHGLLFKAVHVLPQVKKTRGAQTGDKSTWPSKTQKIFMMHKI